MSLFQIGLNPYGHLKDYRAQFTADGFRLVRCAIGEGCVPFEEIESVLLPHHRSLTASLEPGALEARHVRAFTPEWWAGYAAREAREFAHAIGRLRSRSLDDSADVRTPWEWHASADEIVSYEMDQIQRSAVFVHQLGW
ncbi:MAG: hypothetical protein ABI051_15365 [Vicinamibacterales bacterium]